jgi:hypothetical protein
MHRLPWTQTIGLLAPAAGFTVLCVFMLVTGRSAMYAVWLPFALILLVWTILFAVRARTEIGLDGIRDWRPRKELFFPWADLVDVELTTFRSKQYRFVRVQRHDGRWVTLAALRDRQEAPQAVIDDTVDLIRRQIALHRPTDPPAAGEPS